MSSEWDQTCLVCGIKTENRCSSCAKAGIDLFFCSPDHQKLVWKAHRRVCGPGKANLFAWPLLSQLEADEIIAHMHEPSDHITTYAPPLTSVGEGMNLRLQLQAEQLTTMLGVVRSFEAIRLGIGTSAHLPNRPGLDPLTVTAFYDMVIASRDHHLFEPWRPEHRHLTLIQFFLLDLWDRSVGREPPVEWFDRLFARYGDFVRVKIAPTQPQLAQRLQVRAQTSDALGARLAVAAQPVT
ncbi:hypothetical protein JCM9279_005838 [Rhodotorula babjevae]